MGLKKEDLIRRTAEECGISVQMSRRIVSSLFSQIEAALTEGESVDIHGFGSFSVRESKARKGIDFSDHSMVEIPRRRAPKFTASRTLKQKIMEGKVQE